MCTAKIIGTEVVNHNVGQLSPDREIVKHKHTLTYRAIWRKGKVHHKSGDGKSSYSSNISRRKGTSEMRTPLTLMMLPMSSVGSVEGTSVD